MSFAMLFKLCAILFCVFSAVSATSLRNEPAIELSLLGDDSSDDPSNSMQTETSGFLHRLVRSAVSGCLNCAVLSTEEYEYGYVEITRSGRKWWPQQFHWRSKIEVVVETQTRKWKVWRNDENVLVFGIASTSSPGRYHLLIERRNKLRLSRPLPAPTFEDNVVKRFHFKQVWVELARNYAIQNVKTTLFVNEETSNSSTGDRELVLSSKGDTFWDIIPVA